MDNVLKIILGVLGLFALVILAVPSSDEDSEKVVKPVATPISTPRPTIAQATPTENGDEDSNDGDSKDDEWGEDEFESFGQPMNDAKPLGVSDDRDNNGNNGVPVVPGAAPQQPGMPAYAETTYAQPGFARPTDSGEE
ncbi:hypothetical protein [Sphingorhabdus sp.]|uniref:hypothetical protein n=1 Tax=Sphingorhabdus sp. TaxID=1902408 RepID=UPI00346D1EAC